MPDNAPVPASGPVETAPEAAPSPVAAPGTVSPDPEPGKPRSTDWARFRQLEKGIKAKERALAEREAAFGQQWQGAQTKLQELEAKVTQAQKDLEEAQNDPIAWAEKRGVDPNKAVRGYLANGTPEKAIEAAAKRAEAAEKKLDDYIKAQEAKEQERIQVAIKATDEQAVGNFLTVITTNAKEWPYTNAVFTREEIAAKLWELQRVGQKKNERYSMQEVRNAFERLAKSRYTKIQEAHAALLGSAETTPAPMGQVTRQKATEKAASKPTPPKVPRKLTRAEERAADLAALRESMARDAAARAPKATNGAAKKPS